MNAMTKNFHACVETPLKLQANQIITVKRAQGACVQCLHGSVWITLENDPLDFVLAPGERVCINTPGRMVIEGLTLSELIMHAQQRARFGSFLNRAVAILGAGLRRLMISHRCPSRTAFEKATPYHSSFRL